MSRPDPVLEAAEDAASRMNGDDLSPANDDDLEDVPLGLTYQLRFEQFKHVGTLSLVAAGGTLALLQAGLLEEGSRSGIIVTVFAAAAALSLMGQDWFVDGVEAHAKGRPGQAQIARARLRLGRAALGGALVLLGIGVGTLISAVL